MKSIFILCSLFYFFIETLHATNANNILNEKIKEPKSQIEQAKDLPTTQTVLSVAPSKMSYYSQPVTFIAKVFPSHLPGEIPSGSIRFEIDNVQVASVPLENGIAKFTTVTIPASTIKQYKIIAIYSGDHTYASSGDAFFLSVFPADTIIEVEAFPSPSSVGQEVSLTATLKGATPATATPDGSIKFKMDGVTIGNANLDDEGQATITIPEIPVGNHLLSAFYLGNINFNHSGIDTTQEVHKGDTTTTISSSLNPSTFGQAVTYATTVASGKLKADGVVQFRINDVAVTNLNLDANGQALFSMPDVPVGNYTISAFYMGSRNFNESNAHLNQYVKPASTKTAVTSSTNPSAFGQTIIYSAKVTSEHTMPTGTVQFKLDEVNHGRSITIDSNGHTSIKINSLTAGPHQIKAEFLKNANFNPSSGIVDQQVDRADTSTKIESSANPSTFGQTIDFIITVASEYATPTGTVQFKIDNINTGDPLSLDENGRGSINISDIKAGTHQLTAEFEGSKNFKPSIGSWTQEVYKADPTITIESSVNPAKFNEQLTFKAFLSPHKEITSGTIQFQIDGKDMGEPIAVKGQESMTLSIRALEPGNHKVVAIYSGNANFNQAISDLLFQEILQINQ